jgi:uncharacterized repeat protein (TIGR03809 family)
MTHQLNVARGGDTVARWCALAEQRLEYLTELFETGRWRRFHSELAFLENIQEAKTAVGIWRELSLREGSRDNSAVDISWLGRAGATFPRGQTSRDQGLWMQPQASEVADETPASVVSIVPEADSLCSVEESSAPAINETALDPAMDNASALTVDISAMQERYPLLRNAL